MHPLARMIRLTVLAPAALLSLVVQAQSEKTNTPYPSMAPIDRYLIPDAGAEIGSEIHFRQRRGHTPQAAKRGDMEEPESGLVQR